MLHKLINRSPDLKRLVHEGYELEIVSGYLLMHHVPYVTTSRLVKYGTLVSSLTLAGDRAIQPDTHVAFFRGEQPCNYLGQPIVEIMHQQNRQEIAVDLIVDRSFSSRPRSGSYRDYFDKMNTYATILSSQAHKLDPSVTAKTHRQHGGKGQSVFAYTDTATSRAEIGTISKKLEGHKIGIIGLGGTGSYILDLIAKTPVLEIHLFDKDHFLQHNAFRAPGAASQAKLNELPLKVAYFQELYSAIHTGIKAHPVFMCRERAELLTPLDFIFVCVDSSSTRKVLVDVLNDLDKPFIDVGMGVDIVEGQDTLISQLRVSTSTPEFRCGESRIPQVEVNSGNEYGTNIQIAELNSINAGLAVVRWKKHLGFYQDVESEHFLSYALNVNQLSSAEFGKSSFLPPD